jgi:hypothetical protein
VSLDKDIAEAAAPHARYSPSSDTIRPSQPDRQGWMVTTMGLLHIPPQSHHPKRSSAHGHETRQE